MDMKKYRKEVWSFWRNCELNSMRWYEEYCTSKFYVISVLSRTIAVKKNEYKAKWQSIRHQLDWSRASGEIQIKNKKNVIMGISLLETKKPWTCLKCVGENKPKGRNWQYNGKNNWLEIIKEWWEMIMITWSGFLKRSRSNYFETKGQKTVW